MPVPRARLRMSDQELETFLVAERTVRCATVSADGEPHVAPLWFVWHDGAIWLNSLKRSRRAHDLDDGSRVALCIDAGEAYAELRGAVLSGRAQDATDHPDLPTVRGLFGAKYWGGVQVPEMQSHQWLRVVPDRVASWDFAKIPTGADRRLEALAAEARAGDPPVAP